MRLRDILDIYHKELDEIYGSNEVDSFFNLVIEHYLSLNRIHLVLEPEYVASKTEEQPLFEALNRLKSQEPIQYILGETGFFGLQFKVNEHTLIPRPETEELVEWILSCHSKRSDESPIRILDIGTGSGCIAISLSKHLTKAKVFAMDVSKDALKMAEKNATLHEVSINLIHDDILKSGHDELASTTHQYDVIVSNPPYVRYSEKRDMRPNVLDNEPHLALFVEDENPLQFYKAICEFAQTFLKDTGHLYLEINENLGDEMVKLLEQYGFKDVQLKQDIFGKDRMIKGTNS